MSGRACIPVTHARLTPALARAHTLTHALAQVMKQDMELRNIQQIEERKYQVEIMRLKTEVEELKREQKKTQQVSFLLCRAISPGRAGRRARPHPAQFPEPGEATGCA